MKRTGGGFVPPFEIADEEIDEIKKQKKINNFIEVDEESKDEY